MLVGAALAYTTGNALLGSTLAGGAINGLAYEFTHRNDFSWGGYFTQVGIGLAAGFVGGGISSLGGSVLARVAGGAAGDIAGGALRQGINIATGTVSSISSGLAQQFLENAAAHRTLVAGLGSVALYAGIFGAAGSAATEYVAGKFAVSSNEAFFGPRRPGYQNIPLREFGPGGGAAALPEATQWIRSTTERRMTATGLLFSGLKSGFDQILPSFP